MSRRLHIFLALASAFLANAASPAAAQIITERYDGVYLGAATLSSELSHGACPRLPLTRLEIRNGILRAYDEGGRQSVKGIMTGDGFFNADYIFPDGRATRFEGIVDRQGRLTGGVVDGGCIWVVELSKETR